jgi:hypothetical protein
MVPETGINIPRLMELTFLRKDRKDSSNIRNNQTQLLPHPLDITFNVSYNEPLFLNEKWCAGDQRAMESEIVLLKSKLSWLMQQHTLTLENFDKSVSEVSYYISRLESGTESNAFSPDDKNIDFLENFDEVAIGCEYNLSSSLYSEEYTMVVPRPRQNFFFHTKFGVGEYITIKLKSSRVIRKIRITNRLDGCFNRARLIFALFHEGPRYENAKVQYINTPPHFLDGKDSVLEQLIPNLHASYITIISPIYTALHFSGIEVFCKELDQLSL